MNKTADVPETARLPWDRAPAHVLEVTVAASDIDRLDHANNVAYLRWLEDVAWAHSESVGLDFPACRRLGVACVASGYAVTPP